MQRAMARMMLGLLLIGLFTGAPGFAQAQSGRSLVVILSVDGAITPSVGSYLDRGISLAESRGAALVVITLNTPGGDVNTTLKIMQRFENARVPVVVYISPRGGQALSAGTFITLGAHGALMAPNTLIGAAHPVDSAGQDLPETINAKLVNALVGKMENVTRRRGQSAVDWATNAVRESITANEQQALELGLIDGVASSMDELLTLLDGRSVQVGETQVTLHLTQVQIEEVPVNLIEQLLNFLTDPNVVAVLMVIGIQAILIELSSPGGWVAGFIGVVCLAFAAYGLGIIPVNWLGLAFIVIAIVLFIMEVSTMTHGALSAAGIASMVVGILILFNTPIGSPFGRVSVPLVILLAALMGGLFLFVVIKALQTFKRPAVTGAEGLIGATGIVKLPLNPQGKVLVKGEIWDAIALDPPLERDTPVVVVGMEGFRLTVRREG